MSKFINVGIFYLKKPTKPSMKKLIQSLREEIIPLSSRQNLALFVVIACIFQFLFFFAPTLAKAAVEEALAEETEMMVSNGSIFKNENIDEEAAKFMPENESFGVLKDNKEEIVEITIEDFSNLSFFGPEKEPEPQYRVKKTSFHVFTAYNSEAAQTDDSPCITANGFNLCEHGIEDTVAANFLPMGTKIRIPDLFGDRIFVVRDRMNKRYSDRVDVWMLNKADAIKFGVKKAKIEILEEIV